MKHFLLTIDDNAKVMHDYTGHKYLASAESIQAALCGFQNSKWYEAVKVEEISSADVDALKPIESAAGDPTNVKQSYTLCAALPDGNQVSVEGATGEEAVHNFNHKMEQEGHSCRIFLYPH